ncbi:SEC-C metal-binding domain-containing protein [Peribacillus frigoritolerans]|uniref:SEC-C metal-binding domain-containing protein n=1 Tax=Peribacillus frigoritolerans TaxID=450367 RepID=UPI0035CEC2A0
MPAVCDKCGTIFPSGYFLEHVTNATFSGRNEALSPCPSCKSKGHVPDGTFNFYDDTIEILSAPERTIQELQRLSQILRKAKENNSTPEEVKSEIQEETPGLKGLLDLFPQTREEKREDFKFWMNLIIATIGTILTLQQLLNPEPVEDKSIHNHIEINEVINNIYVNQKTEQKLKQKVGRNELCPCGSEIKYKRCHGHYENQVTY